MAAFLVCLRNRSHTRGGSSIRNEWTRWDSPEEGAEALRELCLPLCGPRCRQMHLLVWFDEFATAHVIDVHPPPPPLAEELAALYPRPRFSDEYGPDCWPLDPDLNDPLEREPVGSALAPKIERGHAVQLARML